MRIGSSDQQRSIFSEILSACRAKIKNCIKGESPQNTRINQFSAFINRLSGYPAPAYILELEGFQYAGGIFVYTRGKAGEAFVNLVTALRSFLAKSKGLLTGHTGTTALCRRLLPPQLRFVKTLYLWPCSTNVMRQRVHAKPHDLSSALPITMFPCALSDEYPRRAESLSGHFRKRSLLSSFPRSTRGSAP